MSTTSALTVVGSLVGSYFGSPAGAQFGAMFGSCCGAPLIVTEPQDDHGRTLEKEPVGPVVDAGPPST